MELCVRNLAWRIVWEKVSSIFIGWLEKFYKTTPVFDFIVIIPH